MSPARAGGRGSGLGGLGALESLRGATGAGARPHGRRKVDVPPGRGRAGVPEAALLPRPTWTPQDRGALTGPPPGLGCSSGDRQPARCHPAPRRRWETPSRIPRRWSGRLTPMTSGGPGRPTPVPCGVPRARSWASCPRARPPGLERLGTGAATGAAGPRPAAGAVGAQRPLSRPPQAPPTGRRITSAAPRGWAWWSASGPPAPGRGRPPCRSSCGSCSSATGAPATPWAWTEPPRARTACGGAEARPPRLLVGAGPLGPPHRSPRLGSKRLRLQSPGRLESPGAQRGGLFALPVPPIPPLKPRLLQGAPQGASRRFPQNFSLNPQTGPLEHVCLPVPLCRPARGCAPPPRWGLGFRPGLWGARVHAAPGRC